VVFHFFSRRDSIIFASGAVRKKHRFPGHKGPEYVIHNGLEPLPQLYTRSFLAELHIPEDVFVLGYIAEFKAWKNHVTLLHAFQRLLSQHQNLHLILIGVGETFSTTAQLVKQLNLSEHVHFLHRRVDAKQILGAMDAYVHPSDGEAFGLALAEAMSAGLPVVAANAGALPELVRDEIDGLLFPPLDVEALTQAINRLIDNPHLRMSLGANAQQRIAKNFSASAFSKTLTAALDEINSSDPRFPRRLALTVGED
jgi:glycosyltransferase involved in cell wall biosynthesis